MKRKLGTQILSLLALVMLFYLLIMVAMVIFQMKGVEQWRMLMAMSALQNIGMFIIPAVIVARIFNAGKAMRVMQINRCPNVMQIAMVLLIYVASAPMMNGIVLWNEGWQLPEWLSWLREMEDAAMAATEQMLSLTSVGRLVVAILLVGVLTGIGEEFFFRGSLQRLLLEQNMNRHAAIWITAFIFSVVHMQAFGVVPRMLLGAYFGYLAVWSGSLWLPILAHALNNSVAVAAYYDKSIETMPWIGTEPTTLTFVISSVATAVLIFVFAKFLRKA